MPLLTFSHVMTLYLESPAFNGVSIATADFSLFRYCNITD